MIYQPKPLTQAPTGDFASLVRAAKQRHLVLYLGAGISVAQPAGGPTGQWLAERLRPFAAHMLGVTEQEIADLGLEELAQRVADESTDRMNELRERAVEVFDFSGIEPNYGHEAAALLLREGLVQLYSANWDCGIERAGRSCMVGIDVVADMHDTLGGDQPTNWVPLYKFHGCARRPSTLALTRAEVDEPPAWAVGHAQGALAGGMVAFIGLGTVGLYVCEPLTKLLQAWSERNTTIRVADPQLSDAWQAALGEHAEDVHIPCSADEFLDDLLRAVVNNALDAVEVHVRELAERDGWAATMRGGLAAIREHFRESSADGVLRWWRDGVIETKAGEPFVTELLGRHSLMTVAQLAGVDGGPVEVAGARARQTVATSQRYFEIVCRPDQHIGEVQKVAEHRVRRRREDRVYADGRPVTVVVAGALGEFPASDAKGDIAAGEADATDIAEGVEAGRIQLVRAEDGVQGRFSI
jgi:hypothetical protein